METEVVETINLNSRFKVNDICKGCAEKCKQDVNVEIMNCQNYRSKTPKKKVRKR